MNAYAEKIKAAGLSHTHPRVEVYRYLCEHRTHPTVDTVYHALLPHNPNLSRTTVYNVLRSLVSKDLIQMLVVEEKEMRFDACMDFHAHFKCQVCGEVFDVTCDQSIQNHVVLPAGFDIEQTHLYYIGQCQRCSALFLK